MFHSLFVQYGENQMLKQNLWIKNTIATCDMKHVVSIKIIELDLNFVFSRYSVIRKFGKENIERDRQPS